MDYLTGKTGGVVALVRCFWISFSIACLWAGFSEARDPVQVPAQPVYPAPLPQKYAAPPAQYAAPPAAPQYPTRAVAPPQYPPPPAAAPPQYPPPPAAAPPQYPPPPAAAPPQYPRPPAAPPQYPPPPAAPPQYPPPPAAPPQYAPPPAAPPQYAPPPAAPPQYAPPPGAPPQYPRAPGAPPPQYAPPPGAPPQYPPQGPVPPPPRSSASRRGGGKRRQTKTYEFQPKPAPKGAIYFDSKMRPDDWARKFDKMPAWYQKGFINEEEMTLYSGQVNRTAEYDRKVYTEIFDDLMQQHQNCKLHKVCDDFTYSWRRVEKFVRMLLPIFDTLTKKAIRIASGPAAFSDAAWKGVMQASGPKARRAIGTHIGDLALIELVTAYVIQHVKISSMTYHLVTDKSAFGKTYDFDKSKKDQLSYQHLVVDYIELYVCWGLIMDYNILCKAKRTNDPFGNSRIGTSATLDFSAIQDMDLTPRLAFAVVNHQTRAVGWRNCASRSMMAPDCGQYAPSQLPARMTVLLADSFEFDSMLTAGLYKEKSALSFLINTYMPLSYGDIDASGQTNGRLKVPVIFSPSDTFKEQMPAAAHNHLWPWVQHLVFYNEDELTGLHPLEALLAGCMKGVKTTYERLARAESKKDRRMRGSSSMMQTADFLLGGGGMAGMGMPGMGMGGMGMGGMSGIDALGGMGMGGMMGMMGGGMPGMMGGMGDGLSEDRDGFIHPNQLGLGLGFGSFEHLSGYFNPWITNRMPMYLGGMSSFWPDNFALLEPKLPLTWKAFEEGLKAIVSVLDKLTYVLLEMHGRGMYHNNLPGNVFVKARMDADVLKGDSACVALGQLSPRDFRLLGTSHAGFKKDAKVQESTLQETKIKYQAKQLFPDSYYAIVLAWNKVCRPLGFEAGYFIDPLQKRTPGIAETKTIGMFCKKLNKKIWDLRESRRNDWPSHYPRNRKGEIIHGAPKVNSAKLTSPKAADQDHALVRLCDLFSASFKRTDCMMATSKYSDLLTGGAKTKDSFQLQA